MCSTRMMIALPSSSLAVLDSPPLVVITTGLIWTGHKGLNIESSKTTNHLCGAIGFCPCDPTIKHCDGDPLLLKIYKYFAAPDKKWWKMVDQKKSLCLTLPGLLLSSSNNKGLNFDPISWRPATLVWNNREKLNFKNGYWDIFCVANMKNYHFAQIPV